MAITGISAISGEQLIAAGALSAKSAGRAVATTAGNSLQGLYNTVSNNSASWTGGGSVSITSPSGTILVTDGDKVDGTNSAVALGVVEAGFGPTMYVIPNYITQIQPSWTECFSNLSCPTSGGTIEFNLVGAGEKTIYLSGMDLNWNGVETATTVTLEGNPAHVVLPLGPIVTHCQAKTNGDWIPFSEQAYTASKADTYGPTGIGELAWNSAVTNVVNTVSSNSASWGAGASYTGDAQGALDEVYSNSGTWNTVTNKLDSTAFSTVSGNFLTAHQALPDSANWNSAYNTVTNNSATWNTVTNKLDSTAFSTVSGNFLTAHQDIAKSADWNSTTDTVSSNSANWGGSILPISAGPGVKMDVVNDTLVFSNDETVLWSGNLSAKNTEIVLTDSLKNYDSYKVYGYNTENKYGIVNEYTYHSVGPNWFSLVDTRIQNNNYLTIYGSHVSANTDWDKLQITYMSNKFCISGGLTHSTAFGVAMTKIVGINRTATNL